ncbi:hypothetical protein [Nonomuraea rhodomycinica]|uniref:Uncharacterized protein n=1 Tax=Nonomuraea rhodomycinica TaxID=1712872 RepID=A0A7Y6J1K0_9ACTN|nr:hypothetical protein [Nonomuraea rhodomycinica]NUW46989.1 hypothetical protein [Nonomuraea rhodomycinica]
MRCRLEWTEGSPEPFAVRLRRTAYGLGVIALIIAGAVIAAAITKP